MPERPPALLSFSDEMNVTIPPDLRSIEEDLKRRGFFVKNTRLLKEESSPSAEIVLENGAAILISLSSGSIWVTGPLVYVLRVEAYLGRCWSLHWYKRLCALGLWNITHVFLRRGPKQAQGMKPGLKFAKPFTTISGASR